jgi:hypothetical protein
VCDVPTVTVDIDEGVTPFMIGCTQPGCGGHAFSTFYPKTPRPSFYPQPSHEWYKPDARELGKLSAGERDHVARGGLLMRPRTNAEPVFHGQEKAPSPPDARVSFMIRRNDRCYCGSGKKFKRCCLGKARA